MTRLPGKSALITGAARGIGLAFAERYVEEGARVAIADIDIERAQAAAASLGHQAIAVEIDVTKQDSIDQTVAATAGAFGGIDILINNAAIFTAAPIVEIDRHDFNLAFDINVAGSLFTLQAVAKHMIDRGKGGKIINMASQAGRRGEPLVGVYCATKAAFEAILQVYAAENAEALLKVNIIDPGPIRTGMRAKAMPGEDPMTLKTPEELAPLVLELASAEETRHGEIVVFKDWLG